MKTAVVADVVESSGGAERVLDYILELYPNCDLYSLYYTREARSRIKNRFPGVRMRSSVFQYLVRGDRASKYIAIIKLVSWIYWEFLDLKKYQLVISSSHSFSSKNVKKAKGASHLCYLHTPPRYLYDEYNEIGWIKKGLVGWLIFPFFWLLRRIDQMGAGRPDVLVVNSQEVKKRVERYYQRQAEVLYPPVEIPKLKRQVKRGENYLFLSRLVRQKGAELAVRCCSRYQLPLVVIGEGGEERRLKEISGKTVKFVGRVDDEEKVRLLAGAKALLYASIEEDFGMVPLEAMAAGTPVVAYESGGVRETIKDGISGVFFDRYTVASLKQAIDSLEKKNFNPDLLKKEARSYRPEVFKKGLKLLISQMIKGRQERRTARLWELPISSLRLKESAEKIISWAREKRGRIVLCMDLNSVRLVREREELKNIVKTADLLTADGMTLVWLGRRKGSKEMERVYGPDLMREILADKAGRKIGHFFLGSRSEVLGDLMRNLRRQGDFYGQSWAPPFKDRFKRRDYEAMTKRIKDKRIGIVWIGLGEAKQIEAAHVLKKLIPDKIFITVGAAFDFVSGHKKQAPKWLRQSGGEWLFRLATEPRRLWPRYWEIIRFLWQNRLKA